MSFYENFIKHCNYAGVAPSRAAGEAGLSKSAVTKWKNNPNSYPNMDTVKQIANYFHVSASEFMSDNEFSESNSLAGIIESRPEIKELLLLACNHSKAEVEAGIKILRAAYEMQKL